ncbi:PIR Superfamily Protein [Plasmodium malariae]|uniref:PIR Superfamily Protein n=1 Tax=Plasmodium malariae TaxID=5858 RepID=A0A1A8X5T6_PLAMA|nr:PIR Superfamily Protein [Plasmodium malariae]
MTTHTTEENNTVTLYIKYKSEFETAIIDTQNTIGGGENPGKKCAVQLKHYPNFTIPCQENTVTLYIKYKSEFETAIIDTQNTIGGGENPGRKCAKIDQNYTNFTTPCQEVGRYLIEINHKYKSDSLKRCKYVNYLINSDERYNNSIWFQGYKDFSSQTENICIKEIKIIEQDVLIKLKELYSYYDDFRKFNGLDKDTSGNICNNIKKLYSFYMNNYEECQRNNEGLFCEELNNFKKAYDHKMNNFTPCKGLPHTLPQLEQTSAQILPPKEDYLFVPILTTAIVSLMSFTIFFLYKFTSLKSWIYNRLRKKKIIELKFQEESRESLQNLHEEVNINYEGSSHNISYQPQGDT